MDKRPWRLILLVLPSLGIYISLGWVKTNGCGVCMPISLQPGVWIQLIIPLFPYLAACTCCLTLRPDSSLLHFVLSQAQWTPVVTVIEGSQIFCNHSATLFCTYWSFYWGNLHKLVYVLHTSTSELMAYIVGCKTSRAFVEKFSIAFSLGFCKCSHRAVILWEGLMAITRTFFRQHLLFQMAIIIPINCMISSALPL